MQGHAGPSPLFKPNPESTAGVIATRRLPVREWSQREDSVRLVEEGLKLVASGAHQSMEILLDRSTCNDADPYDPPMSMNFGECILLALLALRSSGYLSDPSCIFTVERVSRPTRGYPDDERWSSVVEGLRIAKGGSDRLYCISLFWLQGSIMFNRESPEAGGVVTVQGEEALSSLYDANNLYPGMSLETVTMNVGDFASMIARREVMARPPTGDAMERALSVLMASHPRAGAASWLGSLPVELFPAVLRHLLPHSVWAALESGLARL